MGVSVREHKDAVVSVDRAGPPSRIARQARMIGWMYVAGAHALAHLEARYHHHVSAGRVASRDKRQHFVGNKWRNPFVEPWRRLSALGLSAREGHSLPRVRPTPKTTSRNSSCVDIRRLGSARVGWR